MNSRYHNELIEELRSVMGAKLAAYVMGRKSTNMEGITANEFQALWFAIRINRQMMSGGRAWDRVTLRSWWVGRNPRFGDESPAEHFKHGEFAEVERVALGDYPGEMG